MSNKEDVEKTRIWKMTFGQSVEELEKKLQSKPPKHEEIEISSESLEEVETYSDVMISSEPVITSVKMHPQREPHQPTLPPKRRPHSFMLKKRKIIVIIYIYSLSHESDISRRYFFIAFMYRGKSIGMIDQMFPPPCGWEV
jgi:hypothetical protein